MYQFCFFNRIDKKGVKIRILNNARLNWPHRGRRQSIDNIEATVPGHSFANRVDKNRWLLQWLMVEPGKF